MVPVALLAALALGDAGEPPAATYGRSSPLVERTFRVGQIYISGHEDMVVSLILNQFDFQSGDVITARTLRRAERRLADLGVFVVDPASGVRPEITVEETAAAANLRINVVEKGKSAR